MRVLKYIAGGVGVLVLIATAALYFLTGGEYEVPATVSEDPDLPRVEMDGYTFHAQTFGDPSNPAVIVLHGGPGGDHRSLLGLQALADEYFVIFYDQRGSGLSERVPNEQLTYQTMLDDLDAFVSRFGSGAPVHLIGHSWGGMLASAYLGIAPEKVVQASASDAYLDALSAHAANTQTPILFLAGECNTWIGPELQDRHARLYPNARLEVVPNAGHDMFWDNPETTLSIVRSFLAE